MFVKHSAKISVELIQSGQWAWNFCSGKKLDKLVLIKQVFAINIQDLLREIISIVNRVSGTNTEIHFPDLRSQGAKFQNFQQNPDLFSDQFSDYQSLFRE